MKKLLVALSIASLFAGSTFANETEIVTEDPIGNGVVIEGAKGQYSFRGEIVNPTCIIKDAYKKVTLPTVWANELETDSKKTDFSIDLNGCSPFFDENNLASKSVSIRFDAAENTLENGLLKNQVGTEPTGTESNVYLKVTQGELNVLSNGVSVQPKVLDKGEFSFNFSVEYAKGDEGNVRPGIVSAVLPFTVIYK
ncbi:fimbrial protein [Ursidibacter arcticus]